MGGTSGCRLDGKDVSEGRRADEVVLPELVAGRMGIGEAMTTATALAAAVSRALFTRPTTQLKTRAQCYVFDRPSVVFFKERIG